MNFPKDPPSRNPHLLSMARGMPCLLRVPGICNNDTDTVVAAHSNLGRHGKGGARKAHDHYSVWACARCHTWLDQGQATRIQREQAFMAGHARQVAEWLTISNDPREDPKDRKAALWALDELA